MIQINLKPIISEKSLASSATGTYMFEVIKSANKAMIAEAVSKLFSVEVTTVRTTILKGKVKRFKGKKGQQKDRKRAYITLKEGQSIKIFEETK